MKFLISFLNTLLPLLYFIATYLYGMYLFREDKVAGRYMTPFLMGTAGLHLLEIVLRTIYYRHFPLASVFEALSVLTLAAVFIYLFLEHRLKVKTTGYFILVFVFFLQLISSAFISFTRQIPEILHSPLFIFHTSAAILGYTGFALSFVYSVMYLLLFHDIKSRRFGIIYSRLPSLEMLSNLNYTSAVIGFSFLTLAIALGSVWSHALFGKYVSADPKILIAYLTWLVYGLEIVGGRYLKWSGKRLAEISIAGLTVVIFSMVTVNLIFTSFHQFR